MVSTAQVNNNIKSKTVDILFWCRWTLKYM